MSVDLLWLAGALILPLLGVAFSMLRSRVDKVEENSRNAIAMMHAEVKDLQVYVRHEVRDINDNLINSLTEDRQFAINKLVSSLETVAKLLEDRAIDELGKKREERKHG